LKDKARRVACFILLALSLIIVCDLACKKRNRFGPNSRIPSTAATQTEDEETATALTDTTETPFESFNQQHTA